MTDETGGTAKDATTDTERREIAVKVFEILSAKSMFERCHWNVSGLFDPTLGRANLTNCTWRAWNAARMMSTVGAFLENLADIGAEATDTGPRPSRAMDLRDDMRRECTKAASAFEMLVVPEFWHPASRSQEIWQDDSIRERWRHLCDLVCGVADVEPRYGVSTPRPDRMPLPEKAPPARRLGVFVRRRRADDFDEHLLSRVQNTW